MGSGNSVELDLRSLGMKVTEPRIQVLALLKKSKEHLSAEELYQKLVKNGEKKIGLATIYRILNQYVEEGLIQRHHFDGRQAVYECGRKKHHDHLVCQKCGSIKEFVDANIEERQIEIAKKNDFKMLDHVMVMYGLCKVCQQL